MTTKELTITLDELCDWLDGYTISFEDRQVINFCLVKAGEFKLEREILHHAYENRNEPDFNLVEQLLDACLRWDL